MPGTVDTISKLQTARLGAKCT